MLDWRKFYAIVTNPFGAKGPFYGKAGHHGTDFAAAPHQDVPTYIKGKCVLNGRSQVLGDYTVLKAGLFYYGWAHLLIGTRPDVGATVPVGGSIGKAAGKDDVHGSAWSGSHCHTTKSLFLTGIFDGRTLNPEPGIRKARTGK